MNKKALLLLGAVLVGIGLLKPSIVNVFRPNPSPSVVVVDDLDLSKPSAEFNDAVASVVKALSVNSDRKTDGKRLASLFNDLSDLILLDGDDLVIKNTEEIRQANKLAGPMLKMDIKGKYEDLPEAAQSLINKAIGDDNVPLTAELRAKAVEAFKALAWASNEGSK